MALVNKAPAPAPVFEALDDDSIENGVAGHVEGSTEDHAEAAPAPAMSANERVAAAAAKAAAAKPAAEDKPAAAVAVVKPHAVVSTIAAADPFKALDNALKVEWNTLPRLMATNGNFQNKETQKLMGDVIGLELLSIQEHYVLSPGGDTNDDDATEFIRYSDDGKVDREGNCMFEALANAKAAGYDKAAIKKRSILVGALLNPGKLEHMEGDLVQIDLAPNSLRNFNQHRLTTAYKVGKNKLPAEGASNLRLEAVVKSERKQNWTEVSFSIYTA